jgi:hypothetical protein
VTAPNGAGTRAEIWGSTWIPGPSQIDGFGDDAGYSIAWVRVTDGPMVQVLVDDSAAPAPGVTGTVTAIGVDDESLDVFTPAVGAGG